MSNFVNLQIDQERTRLTNERNAKIESTPAHLKNSMESAFNAADFALLILECSSPLVIEQIAPIYISILRLILSFDQIDMELLDDFVLFSNAMRGDLHQENGEQTLQKCMYKALGFQDRVLRAILAFK